MSMIPALLTRMSRRAELRLGGRDEPRERLAVGDVEVQAEHAAPSSRAVSADELAVDVADRDAHAGGDEGRGRLAADALRPTGDERDATGQGPVACARHQDFLLSSSCFVSASASSAVVECEARSS